MVADAALSGLRSVSEATGGAMIACPAALRLLEAEAKVEPGQATVWSTLERSLMSGHWLADPLGHARPAYLYLAIHIQTLGGPFPQAVPPASVAPMIRRMLDELRQRTLTDQDPPAIRPMIDRWLWQLLCWHELASWADGRINPADRATIAQQLQWWLGGSNGPLHEMDTEESLDFWTYREFCGLHALAHLHRAYPQVVMPDRLRQIALYHVQNSQPDNTTNQPWGLPLLAMFAESRMLAQQQFHDTITHAASQGRTVAGIAGLLLADAAGWFGR